MIVCLVLGFTLGLVVGIGLVEARLARVEAARRRMRIALASIANGCGEYRDAAALARKALEEGSGK